MRGKRGSAGEDGALEGITPAHAGKTGCPDTAAPARRDHPRACGENPMASKSPVTSVGSPPRMRGKQYAATAPDET